MTKRCSGCGEAKSPAEFHRDRDARDGLQRWCKACTRASNKRTLPVRERERRRLDPDFRQQTIDRRRKQRQDNPDIYRERKQVEREAQKVYGSKPWARRQLARAVAQGKIEKPDACERCGEIPPRHQLHGHHNNYLAPLEVFWLCSLCHGEEHWKVPQPSPKSTTP